MFQSKAHNPATSLIVILFCSIFLFSCAAPPPVKNTVVQQQLQLAGAKWYHFTATAKVDDHDLRNDAPLFCIKFDFAQPGKRSFRDTYLAISADMKTAYKYIYAENLKKRPDGLYDLAFQFKTPANVTTGTVLASGWKNRYPVTISNFAVKENNGSIHYLTGTPLKKQFSVNKFIDTLKISGSVKMKDSSRRLPEKKVIISLKANDSLHRPLKFAPALPWSAAAKSNFIYVVPDKNGTFSHSIKLPQGVASMEIALQTVYFKETVELTDLKVEQLFTPQKLTERELIFDQAVSGGSTVCLNGIISDNDKLPESKSAFAKIIFSDKNGKQLPSPGLAYNRKKKYYYCYLPQQAGQERFSIALQVPRDAVKMQVKLARFYNNAPLTLQSFYIEETIPPLNQRLRNAGIDLTPGYMENGAILDQLWNCFMPEVSLETLINAPVFTKLPLPVGHGYIFDGRDDPCFVSLKDFRPYKLPRSLFWAENPFSHSTWQQKFYTLYWAVMNDQRYDDARYITRIMKSFFKHTPYLYSQNPLCYEDHAISCRIEAMLALYHGVNSDVFKVLPFNGIKSKREFLIRDKFFMKQFFIQMLLDAENIYGILKNQTLGIHNHNLFMAHALLCLSDAFPQLPRAGVYKKTALETINSHLLQMYENDNITAEQSSAYQYTFLLFFCEIYSYLRQSGYANPELLSNLYNKIKSMFGAAVDMLDYDNKFFTIGDSANASFSQLEFAAIQQLLHKQNPSKIVIAEQNRTYPASGIYVFSNHAERRKLLIDISANQKVHGHFDQGNWFLYAGRPVVTDGGGPYKYGSRTYRRLMSSDSHNVAYIDGISQMAGEAYKVVYSEQANHYRLSFYSNVYGPEYIWYREFIIKKDLSKIVIKDKIQSKNQNQLQRCFANIIFANSQYDTFSRQNEKIILHSPLYPENRVTVSFKGNSSKTLMKTVETSSKINLLEQNKFLQIPFTTGGELITEINLGSAENQ